MSKDCPLKTPPFTACGNEKCTWWEHNSQSCAIVSIAVNLGIIAQAPKVLYCEGCDYFAVDPMKNDETFCLSYTKSTTNNPAGKATRLPECIKNQSFR